MPTTITGKIYSIKSDDLPDKIYFGSTTDSLSDRMTRHKTQHRRYRERKLGNYVSSYEILDSPNAYIELVEDVECATMEEMLRKEGRYIQNDPNCVNKNVAGRSRKEYYSDKKEMFRQYYLKNRKHRLEYQNAYNTINREAIRIRTNTRHICECGGKYLHVNKSVHYKTQKHQRWLAKTTTATIK
jgi:hypothetical protein